MATVTVSRGVSSIARAGPREVSHAESEVRARQTAERTFEPLTDRPMRINFIGGVDGSNPIECLHRVAETVGTEQVRLGSEVHNVVVEVNGLRQLDMSRDITPTMLMDGKLGQWQYYVKNDGETVCPTVSPGEYKLKVGEEGFWQFDILKTIYENIVVDESAGSRVVVQKDDSSRAVINGMTLDGWRVIKIIDRDVVLDPNTGRIDGRNDGGIIRDMKGNEMKMSCSGDCSNNTERHRDYEWKYSLDSGFEKMEKNDVSVNIYQSAVLTLNITSQDSRPVSIVYMPQYEFRQYMTLLMYDSFQRLLEKLKEGKLETLACGNESNAEEDKKVGVERSYRRTKVKKLGEVSSKSKDYSKKSGSVGISDKTAKKSKARIENKLVYGEGTKNKKETLRNPERVNEELEDLTIKRKVVETRKAVTGSKQEADKPLRKLKKRKLVIKIDQHIGSSELRMKKKGKRKERNIESKIIGSKKQRSKLKAKAERGGNGRINERVDADKKTVSKTKKNRKDLVQSKKDLEKSRVRNKKRKETGGLKPGILTKKRRRTSFRAVEEIKESSKNRRVRRKSKTKAEETKRSFIVPEKKRNRKRVMASESFLEQTIRRKRLGKKTVKKEEAQEQGGGKSKRKKLTKAQINRKEAGHTRVDSKAELHSRTKVRFGMREIVKVVFTEKTRAGERNKKVYERMNRVAGKRRHLFSLAAA